MVGKKTSTAEVHVLAGRHAGAVEHLVPGMYLVGSSLEADIVLTDDQITPRHFRVGVGLSSVRVEAVEGGARVGSRVLSPGEVLTGRYPLQISAGPVVLECKQPPRILIPPEVLSRARTVAAPAALVGVALGAIIAFRANTANEKHSTPRAQFGAATADAGVSGAAAETRLARTKSAASALRIRLGEANLGKINISEESGMVMARGAIEPPAANAWRDVQLWFDKSFGPDVMLVSKVEVAARRQETPPISIASVWAGAQPYVLDVRGDKYVEGSVLPGGWIVERIEVEKVTLRRDKEVLVLRL